ncbi:MAG TPA: hypothetical protein VF516_04540 [Kofleriaceae bacterium]
MAADVARLIWDAEPEQVDLRAHCDYVMERVMSRGSWIAMRWLRDMYSSEEMADFLVRKGHRLAPRDLAYWSLIAGIELSSPRGGARAPWAGATHIELRASILDDA